LVLPGEPATNGLTGIKAKVSKDSRTVASDQKHLQAKVVLRLKRQLSACEEDNPEWGAKKIKRYWNETAYWHLIRYPAGPLSLPF